jgi:hypothetical protein
MRPHGGLVRNADEEMANADQELEQMGMEALDNAYRAGADVEDLRTLAWLAGVRWSPAPQNVIQFRRQ